MTIAARAIGAREGILYLRGEYVYLRDHLEAVLAERRARACWDRRSWASGFDFDIRIQLGAGAYICGEEGALISSCEGLRGEPKTRPPFPVHARLSRLSDRGEQRRDLCHVARILDRGAEWFHAMGTEGSHGTKLFSVSGDCRAPGVYELPYGVTVRELLALAGAEDAAAVQVGGPSGTMVGRDSFDRRLTFDDLATGGAVIVFSGAAQHPRDRRLLPVLLRPRKLRLLHALPGGQRVPAEGDREVPQGPGQCRRTSPTCKDLSATIIETSRCGLGMTSPNPVLSTLAEFPAGLFGAHQAVGRRHAGHLRHPVGHRRRARDRQAAVLRL